MIYEGNMKIGYIGGNQKGESTYQVDSHYKSQELDWLKRVDVTNQNQHARMNSFQTSLNYEKKYELYKLSILKKDGVMKFFYVLEGLSREEIQSQIEEHWDKSDTIGYDFD
jgi:hypothetical protein